ncbi:MAG: hypothetical protein ABEN55_22055, partial [Bradymonadaceae bacterium]
HLDEPDCRKYRITSSGQRTELELATEETDEPRRTYRADYFEVAWHTLDDLVAGVAGRPVGDKHQFALSRPPRDADLDSRLATLVEEIARADRCAIEKMAGRRMIRIEFPDGSRRISKVSDDDLAVIEKRTEFDPERDE